MITEHCQVCGKEFEEYSCVDDPGKQPEPGDVSLCWGCGTVTRFDENTRRRPLTPEEEAHFSKDPMIQEVRHLMAESYTPAQAVNAFQKAHQ